MKRKEAIKKLRNGEVQIHNDLLPSTKEIKKLLKEAFTKDNDPVEKRHFEDKYFYTDDKIKWLRRGNQKQNLQTVNLSSISKSKNNLKQLEKSFAELSKDVAELKAKDWGSIIPSEQTKALECDFENVKPKEETPIKEEESIDWNVPQLFLLKEDTGFVYFYDGKQGKEELIQVYSLNTSKVFTYNLIEREIFIPFKGTLTINQE